MSEGTPASNGPSRYPSAPLSEAPLNRLPALLCALALLVPVAAVAGKKPMKRKALDLDPLGAEIQATAGTFDADDEQYKALRKADRCLDQDRTWQREQEVPGDARITVNQLYELLNGSVVCWQEAEKKAGKMGEGFVPATSWIAARARYMEAYKQFIWGISAKADGDRKKTCDRLVDAAGMVPAAVAAAEPLADSYQTAGAQALGNQAVAEAHILREMVTAEVANQKCN